MIDIKLSALKEGRPHEYLVRFLFGGCCTVLAGLIAKRYGPAAGGFFLAFPAILTASASLIESHEKRDKARHGMDGTLRGRTAAGLDALGAALGAAGLVAFATVVWLRLVGHNSAWTIAAATLAWAAVSVTLWLLRTHLRRHKRHTSGSIRQQPKLDVAHADRS